MASYTGIVLGTATVIGVRGFSSAPVDDLCRVFVRLVGPDGQPVANRKISFHNTWTQPVALTVQGRLFMGGHQVSMETDADGYAETRLLRGMEVEVVVDGTGYVRVITIPDKVAEDLIHLLSDVLDQFDVVNMVPIDAPRFS